MLGIRKRKRWLAQNMNETRWQPQNESTSQTFIHTHTLSNEKKNSNLQKNPIDQARERWDDMSVYKAKQTTSAAIITFRKQN